MSAIESASISIADDDESEPPDDWHDQWWLHSMSLDLRREVCGPDDGLTDLERWMQWQEE